MSEPLLLIAYLIPLSIIFGYCLMQASLIITHFKYKAPTPSENQEDWPLVTIQLPLYNEQYVAERLVDSILSIEYPKGKLQIQLLDDSTDKTTEILQKKAREYADLGFDIELVRRPERTGFKAGALKYGLPMAKGEFIAIFDADFIPQKDFLFKSIPLFQDSRTGVVQTRWEHINEDYSLLTKLQAFGLDAHFFIEQPGRAAGQHFINFNGTAGVWRKETIEDAGGWSPDTLTEDLDLSYRAQLKGWKFQYLRELPSPAELPVSLPAIKSQQYRWMKGGAECFVKNARKVFKANHLSLSTKLHGFYHLLNSSIFLSVVALAFASIPLVLNTDIFSKYHRIVNLTTLFQVNWLILGSFYWLAFRRKNPNFWLFAKRFFMFLVFMMGLSLHNTIAVIEGYLGRKTPFVRTPKFNVVNKNDSWRGNVYSIKKIGLLTWIEALISLLFAAMLLIDFQKNLFGMMPFHFMVFLGYGLVVFYTVRHALQS
ncbi:cellulose synthase family protein [Jiulongibacter sediminis]|uniref:Histidine kinase n=1 Tax=Jiulongibacter sediminis TaxID=1605367 RepID=A0A0P7C1P9_9BACT|nr:cellulose synthase family protein [Jiulongibacter sediminis]KPM48579.1 histidine kinase [Jiulongibacter sediminis]TBX25117.1 histidine kinase [Jiulongibacter sediminis]